MRQAFHPARLTRPSQWEGVHTPLEAQRSWEAGARPLRAAAISRRDRGCATQPSVRKRSVRGECGHERASPPGSVAGSPSYPIGRGSRSFRKGIQIPAGSSRQTPPHLPDARWQCLPCTFYRGVNAKTWPASSKDRGCGFHVDASTRENKRIQSPVANRARMGETCGHEPPKLPQP